ncbi:hypothetical protein HG530_001911 [Fusarium avenaceum]|nr:hypothetical protein HG530_001911 [Fusarium avenaceum]
MTSRSQRVLQLEDLDLFVGGLGVVHLVLLLAALLDQALHLAHQRPTRRTHSLAGLLQLLLALGHEPCLDSAGGHELRRGCSHIVRCHDKLFWTVTSGDDAVCCLDQSVGRRSHSLGSRNETLRPSVVLLVERCSRRRSAPSLHDLLLCHRSRLDQLRNGVVAITRFVPEFGQSCSSRRDCVRGLAQLRVDEVAQVALLVDELAEARGERLDQLVELLKVHLNVVVAVDHHIGLLQGVHALKSETLKASEELHC